MPRLILALIACLVLLAPAARAQDTAVPPELQARVDGAADILRGEGEIESYFTQTFLAQVPAAQVRAISEQLRSQYGAVESLGAVELQGSWAAQLLVTYERAIATIRLVLDPEPPHRVNGFLIADVTPRNDSAQSLAADFAALPGQAGFLISRLGEEGVDAIAAHNADQQLGVGSGFKLYVLAEAARQVNAGERQWDEVIPLGPASLPSGITQSWPEGSPMTLHGLAALMISISDNTATDTLMRALGRESVDAMVETAGHSAPGRALPLLTTAEAFSIRASANAELLAEWNAAAGPEQRRALLDRARERLTVSALRASDHTGRPASIETVEWFASPADMARALDWLRVNGGETALEILAISPGIAPAAAERWNYVGFKGGSEAGVIAANFLLRDAEGRWYAVNGAWNDPAATVDDTRFMALMLRAIHLARR